MFDWLRGGKSPEVWVIKQVDDGLLHLCGRGTASGEGRAKDKLGALREGRYRGAVRLVDSGVVLNAELFEALVPLDDLERLDDGQARWQGRTWRLAWVPQRCWTFAGHLTTQQSILHGRAELVSVEDVATIRAKASPQAQQPPSYTLEGLDSASLDRPAQRSKSHPKLTLVELEPRRRDHG